LAVSLLLPRSRDRNKFWLVFTFMRTFIRTGNLTCFADQGSQSCHHQKISQGSLGGFTPFALAPVGRTVKAGRLANSEAEFSPDFLCRQQPQPCCGGPSSGDLEQAVMILREQRAHKDPIGLRIRHHWNAVVCLSLG